MTIPLDLFDPFPSREEVDNWSWGHLETLAETLGTWMQQQVALRQRLRVTSTPPLPPRRSAARRRAPCPRRASPGLRHGLETASTQRSVVTGFQDGL